MNRMSLNTAIMSFAFSGILAPHRYPGDVGDMTRETYEPTPANPIDDPAARYAQGSGSVWIGATTAGDAR